ncbi:MAG TPA: VWA domain-containing protein [Candidatus Paceibacterota bacterium]|nr:VWA domain-containing protein [Candidatus Paceibacterota bacterium]
MSVFTTKHTNDGFTLLFSVLIMGFLMSVAVAILGFSTRQISISGIGRDSQSAFYAADSGVECIRFNDDQGNIHPGITEVDCHGIKYRVISITEVRCPEDADCDDNADPSLRYTKYIFAPAKLVSGTSNNVPEIEIVLIKQFGGEGLSTLTSRGRNTGITTGNRVERAIKVTYKPKSCFEDVDIFLVVDGSGSILPEQIPGLKRNLKDFAQELLSDSGNRIGLIVFRGLAHIPVRLTDNYTELATAIDSIKIAGDTNRGTSIDDSWDTYFPSDDDTNIPLGFRYALNEFNDEVDTNELDRKITLASYASAERLNRPNSKDIVVLFTDGAPDSIIDGNNNFHHEIAHNPLANLGTRGPLESVITEATRLKAGGANGPVELFTVGISGSDYRRCDDDWNSPINQCTEGFDEGCWKDRTRLDSNERNEFSFNESCPAFMNRVVSTPTNIHNYQAANFNNGLDAVINSLNSCTRD